VKRLVRVSASALSVLLLLASITIWDAAFRTPATNLLPLAEGLIPIASSSGQALLSEKRYIADYERLTQNFESQSRPAFCGVASSVVVLNALRSAGPRVTQATFFTDAASKVRGSLQVTFAGMSLAQLGGLLHAHGLAVTLFYASDIPVDAFRSIARENLRTSGDFVLVNYQRAVLGQGKIGHISPLAAYNASTDRFLILDVAAYKYPPVWVSTAALWNAMNTLDSSSDRTRGFILVKNGDASEAATPPGQQLGSHSR